MAVYFIRNTRTKHIKIGVSENPKKRLHSLQTANHDRLEIIGVMPGSYVEETELHRRFAVHRFRNGEWFRNVPGLTRTIREYCIGGLSLNVWDQCLIRDRCRYGLTGVSMRHVPSDRIFTCGGSEWGADEVLFVFMSEGPEPEYDDLGMICLADIRMDSLSEKVPALECVLSSPWPIICCSQSAPVQKGRR